MRARFGIIHLACLTLLGTGSQALAVPPRTTAIRLKNETGVPLVLVKDHLEHGDWTPKLTPPAVIKPGESGYWKSESNELGTNGTAGNIHYRIGDAVWQAPFTITPDRLARAGSGVTSCSHNPDQVDVFWIAGDGSINSIWWNSKPNKWSAPSTLAPAGSARADSPLTVLSRTKEHMDLFWIGPDGAIHTTYWSLPGNKWSAPLPITAGGVARAGSSLEAAAREAGHMDLFWIGPNSSVETVYWPVGAKDNNWAKPFSITPPNVARADSTLTATPRTGDEVHVFFVTREDGISSTFWTKNAGKWAPPFSVTAKGTVAAGSDMSCLARTKDHIEVVWVNRAGAVSHTWADRKDNGGKWHDPFAISPPNAARAKSPLTMMSRLSEQIDVFWIAPNGSVNTNWWSSKANKGNWNSAFTISPPNAARADAGMAALSRVGHHLDVFWINAKGGVSSAYFDSENVPEVYISWDNPFISSQYGNTYHQFSPDNYELSYTGGSGNHAEADFVLAKTKLHAVKGFKPSVDGFHFSNSDWKKKNIKLPVVEIDLPKPIGKVDISNTSEGMCGGMVFAVMDYFKAKKQIPQTTDPPARESDPLFQYLKHRLITSWDITGAGANYVKFMRPDYPDGDEGVVQGLGVMKGRSFVVAREEWPKIKADIDANRLCPLGLVQVRSLNPLDIGKNHQVLAYAYELSANDVTLHIYDPNVPGKDSVQLKFNVGDWAGRMVIHRYVDGMSQPKAINTIFRSNYEPPAAALRLP